MYQHSQVHKEYLQNIQVILGTALLNQAHFFKATNDFKTERAKLAKEQEQDLSRGMLDSWKPEEMREEQYFNQLAENNGELS